MNAKNPLAVWARRAAAALALAATAGLMLPSCEEEPAREPVADDPVVVPDPDTI